MQTREQDLRPGLVRTLIRGSNGSRILGPGNSKRRGDTAADRAGVQGRGEIDAARVEFLELDGVLLSWWYVGYLQCCTFCGKKS